MAHGSVVAPGAYAPRPTLWWAHLSRERCRGRVCRRVEGCVLHHLATASGCRTCRATCSTGADTTLARTTASTPKARPVVQRRGVRRAGTGRGSLASARCAPPREGFETTMRLPSAIAPPPAASSSRSSPSRSSPRAAAARRRPRRHRRPRRTPRPSSPRRLPPTGGTYWLRMTTFQAIPPVNLFAVPPTATITGDGQYLVQGAVPAIYPGPARHAAVRAPGERRRPRADPGLGGRARAALRQDRLHR